MEGPCGEPKIDVEGGDYAHFLLISGGIGITPLQSVANQLLDEKRRGRKVRVSVFGAWSIACTFVGLSQGPMLSLALPYWVGL